MVASGETLTWNVGVSPPGPWVQAAGGGSLYAASGILKSFLPQTATTRSFLTSGAGGYPGVVIYGSAYDFDASPTAKGESLVSPPSNWLANQTFPGSINYYELFWYRSGSPKTFSTFQELKSSQESMDKPPSRTVPYYIDGDMTTSGNWTVGSGETITFLITGDLFLKGTVNITGTGFVAFIVNGTITVDPSVGGPSSASDPVIEGLYVTSPTGVFATSLGDTGHERFVGKGIFIAGSFLLQRDLDTENPTTPAELFLYNPQLPFTMPDKLKDYPITWQEVAP